MLDLVLTYVGAGVMIVGIITVIVSFTIEGINWWRFEHGSR